MVRIQAHTIRPATPHRTADSRCAAPTPEIAPVIVCVVLTGMPKYEASEMVNAAPGSAQKPPNGVSFVRRCPIVFTIRQPPAIVPEAMARLAAPTTQHGTVSAEVGCRAGIGKS